MDVESVAATVYEFTIIEFKKSLFHEYESEDIRERLAFLDWYLSNEFLLTHLRSVAEEGSESKYQNLCRSAYPEYTGENFCGYNLALAFINTKKLLEDSVSKNHEDWKWGNLHVVDFRSLPWSKSPLKFFFDRQIKTGGNSNTPNASKYNLARNVDKPIISST